jgi:hypothetical protein
MAFVTQKQWVCNCCGKQQVADSPDAADGWLHVKWWRTNEQVFEIDLCSLKCALNAERILNRTLSAHAKPSESM